MHPSSPNQHPPPLSYVTYYRSSSSFCAIISRSLELPLAFLLRSLFQTQSSLLSVGRSDTLVFPLFNVIRTLVVLNPFKRLFFYTASAVPTLFLPPPLLSLYVFFFHDWRLLDEYPRTNFAFSRILRRNVPPFLVFYLFFWYLPLFLSLYTVPYCYATIEPPKGKSKFPPNLPAGVLVLSFLLFFAFFLARIARYLDRKSVV